MADFACLFEQDDGSFCMEAVAVAGQRCARHTRVVEVPVVAAPRQELLDDRRCIAIKNDGQRCSHARKGQTDRCGKHKDWVAVQRCAGQVLRGGVHVQCPHPARPGRTMCGIHKTREPEAPAVPAPAPAPVAPAVRMCRCVITSRSSAQFGQECGRTTKLLEIPAGPGAQPEFCCRTHRVSRERKLRDQWGDLDMASVRAVIAETEVPGLNPAANTTIRNGILFNLRYVPMTIYSTDPALARQESMRRAREAMQIWAANILRRQERAAAPPPRSDLERFTQDGQNIHTAAANTIVTNANTELEKAEAISGSLKQIKLRFEERNFGTPTKRKEVHKDMKKWYSAKEVMRAVGQMEANDFGYQRLLDKVWGLVQKSKHKDDLEQRLWEEAVDSLGMCTQGHMTRLANVLQGFEESAEAPKVEIPKGERLQTAMAQIAELPQNERESAARRVFAELEIPEDRQGSWLEALEVA